MLLSFVLALLWFLVFKNSGGRFSLIVFYSIFGIHSVCCFIIFQSPETQDALKVTKLKVRVLYALILLLGTLMPAFPAFAAGEKEEGDKSQDGKEEFDASTFIIDHVTDSHEWHLWTKKDGSGVAVYLPVILYDRGSGFHFFSSKKIAHGHSHEGFAVAHEGER